MASDVPQTPENSDCSRSFVAPNTVCNDVRNLWKVFQEQASCMFRHIGCLPLQLQVRALMCLEDKASEIKWKICTRVIDSLSEDSRGHSSTSGGFSASHRSSGLDDPTTDAYHLYSHSDDFASDGKHERETRRKQKNPARQSQAPHQFQNFPFLDCDRIMDRAAQEAHLRGTPSVPSRTDHCGSRNIELITATDTRVNSVRATTKVTDPAVLMPNVTCKVSPVSASVPVTPTSHTAVVPSGEALSTKPVECAASASPTKKTSTADTDLEGYLSFHELDSFDEAVQDETSLPSAPHPGKVGGVVQERQASGSSGSHFQNPNRSPRSHEPQPGHSQPVARPSSCPTHLGSPGSPDQSSRTLANVVERLHTRKESQPKADSLYDESIHNQEMLPSYSSATDSGTSRSKVFSSGEPSRAEADLIVMPVFEPSGDITATVLSSDVIKAANLTVQACRDKASERKKRGTYAKYMAKDRAEIAKYAMDHGSTAAVRNFKERFPNLSESTVRDFRNKYAEAVKEDSESHDGSCISDAGNTDITELKTKKRGRPVALGEDLDNKLRAFLGQCIANGIQVTTTIIMETAREIVNSHSPQLLTENGGPLDINKSFAQSIVRRLNTSMAKCRKMSMESYPVVFEDLFEREVSSSEIQHDGASSSSGVVEAVSCSSVDLQ